MESFEELISNSSSAPNSIITSGIPEISTEQLKNKIKLFAKFIQLSKNIYQNYR